jgi:hypothetical protein
LGAGTDLAPLFVGLENDMCQGAHWGYVIFGEVVVTYDTGKSERCTTDEVFYWPPGHTVRVEQDSELIMFSPQAEHTPVMDHILAKLASA